MIPHAAGAERPAGVCARIHAMKGRSLALFLLVYLSLDLGNPFMPGAVTFVDGELQVVDAGRPAGLDLPIPAAAHAVASQPEDPSPASPGVAAGPPRPRWIPAPRAPAGAADPVPAPDDH